MCHADQGEHFPNAEVCETCLYESGSYKGASSHLKVIIVLLAICESQRALGKSNTMKEIVVTALSTITTKTREVPIPSPKADEVVIKVLVTGSNVKGTQLLT